MELALTAFMTGIGFTFSEVLKMLVLVGMNFIFIGALFWRFRNPIKAAYDAIMKAMESIPAMQKSIADLNHTMQEHIVQTDLRMQAGDARFEEINKRLEKLESK